MVWDLPKFLSKDGVSASIPSQICVFYANGSNKGSIIT